jgi:hypothetical protein
LIENIKGISPKHSVSKAFFVAHPTCEMSEYRYVFEIFVSLTVEIANEIDGPKAEIVIASSMYLVTLLTEP